MKDVAVKVKINDAVNKKRVNVIGKVYETSDEINSKRIGIEDESGKIFAEFKGGLSLLAENIKKEDLVLIIGDIDKDIIIGEIIKKLEDDKYIRLRDLELVQ